MNQYKTGFIYHPVKYPCCTCRCDECLVVEAARLEKRKRHKSPEVTRISHNDNVETNRFFFEHLKDEFGSCDEEFRSGNRKERVSHHYCPPECRHIPRRHAGEARFSQQRHSGANRPCHTDFDSYDSHYQACPTKTEECPIPCEEPIKAQNSRSYLRLMKLVNKMKPWWEKVVAAEQPRDCRKSFGYGAGIRYGHQKHVLNHHQRRHQYYQEHAQHRPTGSTRVRAGSDLESESSDHHHRRYYHHKSRSEKEDNKTRHIGVHSEKRSKLVGGDYIVETVGTRGVPSSKKHHKEHEFEELESSEWDDSGSESEEQAGPKTELEIGTSVTPSWYDFKRKRGLFSPTRIQTATARGESSVADFIQTAKSTTIHKLRTEQETREAVARENVSRVTKRWEDIRSEGQTRNMVRSNHRRKESPLKLSRFSQTQAELELDFRLLQKHTSEMESKYSQTEMVEESHVEEDKSWEEWISEGSKRKPKKKSNFDLPFNQEIDYNPLKVSSKTVSVTSNSRSELHLAPRRSHSDTANPTAMPGHFRTSLHIENPLKSVGSQSHNRIRDLPHSRASSGQSQKLNQIHRPKTLPTAPLIDGMKVIRHSKSMYQTPHFDKMQTEKSVFSVPTHKHKRHAHDSAVYYTASPTESLVSGTATDTDTFDFVTESASQSFAMEQAGPTYGCDIDEALRQLSEQYDNLIVTEAHVQCLNVQDSKTVLNESVSEIKANGSIENLSFKLERNLPIVPQRKYEPFVWKSYSFIRRGRKVCQECRTTILDGEEFLEGQCRGQDGYDEICWHKICFRCVICRVPLTKANNYFIGNRIYCAQHYADRTQNVPRCKGCNELILDEKYTLARGCTWHMGHFKCASCGEPIIDTKYLKVHDRAYCFECHKHLLSKKCTTCGHRITATQEFVQTGDQYRHAKDACFHCFTCHKSLMGQNRMFEKNGVTYCNKYCALMNIPPA